MLLTVECYTVKYSLLCEPAADQRRVGVTDAVGFKVRREAMLCAHVLQCGCVQRFNDYGFVCVIFHVLVVHCARSVCPLFPRSKGLLCLIFNSWT